MKHIFYIDYGTCNFHNLISLVESGYKVTMMPSQNNYPESYYKSFGIDSFITNRESAIYEWIDENDVDIVINSNPRMPNVNGHIQMLNERKHKNIEFLGLRQSATVYEMAKLHMNLTASDLGLKAPKWSDRYDHVTTLPTAPYVLKPKVCVQGFDHAIIVTDPNIILPRPDGMHFYEEYIEGGLETNVAYCVAKGKWSILHTQEVRGEDICKMFGASPLGLSHWTKVVEFDKLSEENEKLAVESAETILEYMAERDTQSSYVGQITGLIKDGEWIFIENNVRPEQTNSLPHFVTGDEFLEALRGSPEILANDEYKNIKKIVVIPTEDPDAVYPYHLHDEFDVAVPCGLDIIDDEYKLADMFKSRSDDNIIGVIVADKEIPEGFIKGFEDTGWHVRHQFNI